MSLRTRIAVTSAMAVAVSVVLASAAIYFATSRSLHDGVDRALALQSSEAGAAGDLLRTIASRLGPGGVDRPQRPIRPGRDDRDGFELPDDFDASLIGARQGRFGGAGAYLQLIDADGAPVFDGAGSLPTTLDDAEIAAGTRPATYRSDEVEGAQVRILTVPVEDGLALQVARPLDEIHESLEALRLQLGAFSLLGIGLAGGAGLVVSRRAVAPVRDLRDAATEVARTGDLSHRIEVRTTDELGTLASSFNEMLSSLDQARRAQQQLVADASHELRTPLTSLKTNIEVLLLGDRLPKADRADLLRDVEAQLDEFGRLVSDLVELARDDLPVEQPVPVRFDEVVAMETDRIRLHHRDLDVRLSTAAVTVLGAEDRLARAVANLLANAAKYGGDAGVDVTVEASDGYAVLTVRDHGPGVDDADLPHVFERFYRAPAARGQPGSGLGLAIVAQVAQSHGGTATIANDGGAVATISFPLV